VIFRWLWADIQIVAICSTDNRMLLDCLAILNNINAFGSYAVAVGAIGLLSDREQWKCF
jgi:hypothetical protein